MIICFRGPKYSGSQVLGAVANTFMKLLLVLSLGDRGLFKQLLGAVIIIGVAGLASAFLYYDFS